MVFVGTGPRDLTAGLSDANAVIAEAEAEALMEMIGGHLGSRMSNHAPAPRTPAPPAEQPMEVEQAAGEATLQHLTHLKLASRFSCYQPNSWPWLTLLKSI